MPTHVVMPQMGESIAEGTIVRWIKKAGDHVDKDEPLFEISTDKVDAEIPAPAAGILTEIRVKEGETVAVNSVVALIGGAGEEAGAEAPAAPPPGVEPARAAAGTPAGAGTLRPAASGQPEVEPGGPAEEPRDAGREGGTKEALRRQKSSPLVRRIAREHNVDISGIEGTGVSGRVTKSDILGYIESGQAAPAGGETGEAGAPRTPPAPGPAYRPGENVQIVPMSVMRRKIAEHMVLSAHTSPHVYSVYEVNFGQVSLLRDRRKAAFEAAGAKLTFTAFVAKAVLDALREFPIVNASIDGDNIVYKKDINLGIAVALDNGLIVPVIRNADEKNLLGLSRAIGDLAALARSKKLSPDEVQAGTFTITNPGIFGALYGLPLINQPQVAILGVGIVSRRPVVVGREDEDESIAIRNMVYLSLTYDHRIVDGADAARYLSVVKMRLEQGVFAVE